MKRLLMKDFHVFTRLLPFLLIPILIFISCGKDDVEEGDNLIWVTVSGSGSDTTTYYVSPQGSDASDGMSESTAFHSIVKALQVISPGGRIKLLAGTYSEAIGIRDGGNSLESIIIEGYKGSPILDGKDSKIIGLYFENCDNFIIRNLTFQNYTDIGISVVDSKRFILRDLIVKENGHDVQLESWEFEGYGIHVENSVDVQIIDNDVSRNGPEPQIIPDFIMGTGINTYGNTDVLIKGNTCYNNIGGGILVEDSEDVIVEDNEVFGNDLDATIDQWWDGGLWLDGGKDVIVRNNHFHHNLGPGIQISDEDKQKPTGYVLENNISTENYYGIYIWNFGTTGWPNQPVLNSTNDDFSDNSIQDVWIEAWG